ncbi:phage protein, HK97 gp10 family [Clostridium sp. USBA 49]|jgi:HK97 gp10 family phage protein|uniref:HK97-gp10 family putative phage morphogenesis protein n=1 Tax=Clostridium sp. USBA 49 TaxID=1881060 RepID=UPI000999391B|nr:HK97-gp10 family putative phage morphogenesis protein [Clostridium sp. USBA 49]SKA89700.1 phage protein, HK97 gp10 family [Clostridium sp. USBA 49]
MSVDVEVIGMNELIERIKELGPRSSRIQNEALKKAAEPILEDAVSTTAFKDRSGKGRAGLKIGRPKSKGDTKYVLVGIDKSDISEIFYMKFIEYGTSKMSARPFLRPALLKNKDKAYEIMKDELRKGLGLK